MSRVDKDKITGRQQYSLQHVLRLPDINMFTYLFIYLLFLILSTVDTSLDKMIRSMRKYPGFESKQYKFIHLFRCDLSCMPSWRIFDRSNFDKGVQNIIR